MTRLSKSYRLVSPCVTAFGALLLSSCDGASSTAPSGQRPVPMAPAAANQWAHVCGNSPSRADYCPTDFVRLAAQPMAANGKDLWILGFLAVDRGHVVLFADEFAYEHMEFGRSIQVQGNRDQLRSLVNRFGYKTIRLGGRFRANAFDDPRNDRLGELLPPIEASAAEGIFGERLGADDIAVSIEFHQPSTPAENEEGGPGQ